MKRLLLSMALFMIGGLIASIAFDYEKSKSESFTPYANIVGNELTITVTVVEANDSKLLLQPIVFDSSKELPNVQVSLTPETAYGEVVRTIKDGTIIASNHYDVTETNLNPGDVVYVLFNREESSVLRASSIRKAINSPL